MALAGLLSAVTSQVSGTAAIEWQLIAFFSFVSPLPLLWVGLRTGFTNALTASGIAVGLVLTANLFGAPYDVVTFLPRVLMILTLVKFSLLSRRTETNSEEWYPAGQILAYLLGITVCAMLAQMAFESGSIYSDETLREYAKQFANSPSIEEQMYDKLKLVFYFYPGIMAVSTLLVVVGNAGLTQKLLERKKQNIRPQGAFSKISLPSYYLLFAVIATGLTAFSIGGPLGPNLLLVVTTGFFLVGLNLIHECRKLYNFGTMALVVFYVIMIFFGWLAAPVSLLGLLEPWLRSHLKVLENLKG